MKPTFRFFCIATVGLFGGCHKQTLADCSFSASKSCSDLRNAADQRQEQLENAQVHADIAREQARMNAAVAPPADYQDMTKGLPKPK